MGARRRRRPAAHRFAARIYEDMGAIDLAEEAAARAVSAGPTDRAHGSGWGGCGCSCWIARARWKRCERARALGADGEVRDLLAQALALEPRMCGSRLEA